MAISAYCPFSPEMFESMLQQYMQPYEPPGGRGIGFYIDGPDDVSIYTHGFSPRGYYITRSVGPCHRVNITAGSIEDAFYIVVDRMREDAFYLGCNAVIGWECILHAWEEPIACAGTGTCVVLKKN